MNFLIFMLQKTNLTFYTNELQYSITQVCVYFNGDLQILQNPKYGMYYFVFNAFYLNIKSLKLCLLSIVMKIETKKTAG